MLHDVLLTPDSIANKAVLPQTEGFYFNDKVQAFTMIETPSQIINCIHSLDVKNGAIKRSSVTGCSPACPCRRGEGALTFWTWTSFPKARASPPVIVPALALPAAPHRSGPLLPLLPPVLSQRGLPTGPPAGAAVSSGLRVTAAAGKRPGFPRWEIRCVRSE